MTDQEIPRFASGVTAVYGLSGSGKSSLCDTAAEYVAERFQQRTFCVANDPGGWGNRRLSLIRAGVMVAYDPSNHVDYFDTLEKLSKGAMPEKILDPDRGYADPNVPLIFPRQTVFVVQCPNGHPVARFTSTAVMMGSQTPCPTCGILTTPQNQVTEKLLVKPAIFNRIGLRIFDSITANNDRGLLELANMSARGELPTSGSGGSALGSADALRQGDTAFGTGSKAQVGFMQNRTYGWLINIRAIPDQVIGAICTFGVEQSGGDDSRGGGEICYGPALAGTARTARAGGWVGTLLHATKEPDDAGRVRHRLWLTNHIDPRDTYKRPYLAKHRGTPLGMPDYLEDPWSDDPKEREKLAWSKCSLKYFYELQEKQFAQIAAADAEKYASFASFTQAPGDDEVVTTAPVATPVMTMPVLMPGAGAVRPQMPSGVAAASVSGVLPPAGGGLRPTLSPPPLTPVVQQPAARVEQVPTPQAIGVQPPAPVIPPAPTAPVATPVPAPLAPMPLQAAPIAASMPQAAPLPSPATAPAPPGPIAARPSRTARPPVN